MFVLFDQEEAAVKRERLHPDIGGRYVGMSRSLGGCSTGDTKQVSDGTATCQASRLIGTSESSLPRTSSEPSMRPVYEAL